MTEPSEAAISAAERIFPHPDRQLSRIEHDALCGKRTSAAVEIQAAIASSRPKWSAEKPTKAGWYFLKYPSGRSTVGTVDEYMDFYAYGTCWSVAHMPGQWAGPLAEPEETK